MSADGGRLLAVVQAVRYKKQDGVLVLSRDSLGWSQEGESELALDVPLSRIKTHRLSKEGGSKIQIQLVLHDGSTCNLHFTSEDAKSERAQVSKLLIQLVPNVTSQASAELEAKTALLQSDQSLHQLYRDLVITGVISADEFWANRLPNGDGRSDQQSGIPSAFLADVPMVADGCNSVKLNITPDEIQAIFITYPSVKAKHAQLVPDQMTETDFWVQFFQSQKFHRDRNKSYNKKANMFDECLQQDHASVSSIPASLGHSLRQILPTRETTAEWLTNDGLSEPSTSRDLVQRCNLHSALVLQAIHPHQDNEDRSLTASAMEDTALQLQTVSPHSCPETSSTALQHLAHELSTHEPTSLQLPSSNSSSAMSHLLPGGSLMDSGQLSSVVLSAATTQLLVRHQAVVAEILRHFWTCFPVISPALEQKVHRMAQCLVQYKDEQLAQAHAEVSSCDRHVVEHLISCVGVALTRYHEWNSRQSSN